MADDAHKTTYAETLMHSLKANIGTGLFAMGSAVRNSGLILGPLLITFLGILCLHCEHLLLNACQQMKDTLGMDHFPDYADTIELCFANGSDKTKKMSSCMRMFINIFLVVSQLGFCCVYLVFVASTAQQILEWCGVLWDVRLLMVIVTIPISFTCLIRNLKYLAPFSAFANICLFLGFIICVYYTTVDLEVHDSVENFANPERIPLSIGTALFAFTAIGTVIPIKIDMIKPEQYDTAFGVLNVAKITSICFYIALGVLAYLKYGDGVEGSVTLNLPNDEVLAQVVKGLTGLAILFTYAIQYYVPFCILWSRFEESKGPFARPLLVECIFRIGLVFITFLLGVSIPYLDLVISLVGALCSSLLALFFPTMVDFVAAYQASSLTMWVKIKNTIIVIFCFFGTISGTYASVQQIVLALKNDTAINELAMHWTVWGPINPYPVSL